MIQQKLWSALLLLLVGATAGAYASRGGMARPDAEPGAEGSAGPVAERARADTAPLTLPRQLERAERLEASGELAEAGRVYLEAAERWPDVGRWLRLSALQSLARAGRFDEAREISRGLLADSVVPADSVRLEVARAAFRAGEPERGLALARRVEPASAPGLWTRWAAPRLLAEGDTAGAVAAYRGVLSGERVPTSALESLLALDRGWSTLELVAGAELRAGREERGAELLGRALAAAPDTATPRLAVRLVRVHLSAGETEELLPLVASWTSRPDLPGAERASLFLAAGRAEIRRGRGRAAEEHLRRSASAAGTRDAARAAYLLADLAEDAGRESEAEERFRRVVEDFPRTRYGARAQIRMSLGAYSDGDYARSARLFRAYRRIQPGGSWTQAALYWEGRALEAAGAEGGGGLYRRALRAEPLRYYGIRAAERLGADPVAHLLGRAGPDAAAAGDGAGRERGPSVAPEPLVGRMDRLARLEWRGRARMELAAARRRAGGEDLLPLASRLNASGWTEAGISLAWEAFRLRDGRWSEDLLRAIFPLPYRGAVVRAAREGDIEPALLAALLRQESGFDARAVSRAGAVGLAQLMPPTARSMAERAGVAPPDSQALLDPELNLALGARYLATLLRRFDGSRTAALAGYNAGPRHSARWQRMPEYGLGEELFIERIPFAETRRYVKAVYRNEYLYRRLYGLPGGWTRVDDAGRGE